MAYRDECLLRIEAARARMDEVLRTASDADTLRSAWHGIVEEFAKEQVPETDRIWLSDRLQDLLVHVRNSPRWRQMVEDLDRDLPPSGFSTGITPDRS